MGGNTDYWGLPYPTGTDRVADGDNAMEALAVRVETILTAEIVQAHTGYAALAPLNGWAGTISYAIRSGWVNLTVTATKAGWGPGEVLANLPAGTWPGSSAYVAAATANEPGLNIMSVNQDGTVRAVLAGTALQGGIVTSYSWPLTTAPVSSEAEAQPSEKGTTMGDTTPTPERTTETETEKTQTETETVTEPVPEPDDDGQDDTDDDDDDTA